MLDQSSPWVNFAFGHLRYTENNHLIYHTMLSKQSLAVDRYSAQIYMAQIWNIFVVLTGNHHYDEDEPECQECISKLVHPFSAGIEV